MTRSRLAAALLGTALLGTAFLVAGCADAARNPVAPDAAFAAQFGRPFAPGSIVPGSLAFVSTRTGGRSDIFAMNPGGDRVIQLTFSARDEVLDNQRIEFTLNRPVWSPDGRSLLFTRRAWDLGVTPNALIHDIHILELSGEDPRPRRLMVNATASGTPTWSPDGARVAYCSANAGTNEIWIYDIATEDMTRTTSGPACWPSWSPDGTRIAFQRAGAGARIGVLEVATGVVTFITSHAPDNVAGDFFPRWSPDSKWIAFASGRAKDAAGARYQGIYLVPADGSAAPLLLTPLPDGVAAAAWNNTQPVFSNNGKHIYFESRRAGTDGAFQLFRMDRDGSDVVQLTSGPGANTQADVRPTVRP